MIGATSFEVASFKRSGPTGFDVDNEESDDHASGARHRFEQPGRTTANDNGYEALPLAA
jgi:hypothetical protein